MSNPRQTDVNPKPKIGFEAELEDGTLIRILESSGRVNGPPILRDTEGVLWTALGPNGRLVPFETAP